MLKDKVANIFTKADEADHGYIVQPVKFLPLDIDAIKRELGIEEAAALRGQQELPKADIGGLDDTERKITGDIEGRRKMATDVAEGQLKAYAMRIGSIDFHSEAQSLRARTRKAEGDFRTTMQHAVDQLGQLKKERDRAEADLHSFREANRLSREARLPKWPKFLSSLFSLLRLCARNCRQRCLLWRACGRRIHPRRRGRRSFRPHQCLLWGRGRTVCDASAPCEKRSKVVGRGGSSDRRGGSIFEQFSSGTLSRRSKQ